MTPGYLLGRTHPTIFTLVSHFYYLEPCLLPPKTFWLVTMLFVGTKINAPPTGVINHVPTEKLPFSHSFSLIPIFSTQPPIRGKWWARPTLGLFLSGLLRPHLIPPQTEGCALADMEMFSQAQVGHKRPQRAGKSNGAFEAAQFHGLLLAVGIALPVVPVQAPVRHSDGPGLGR